MSSSKVPSNLPKVVVAGQTPPPYGGQNINTQRVIELLRTSGRYDVVHLPMNFSKGVRSFRRFEFGKLLELVVVVWRCLRIRLGGKIDLLIYPTGGPHLMPACRDIALLPIMRLVSANVWVHFRAGGIAERLESFSPLVRCLLSFVHRVVAGAIVNTHWGGADPKALGIERVEVISNGLEDHGVPDQQGGPDDLTLLSVGHLSMVKGTPHLVSAFRRLADDYPTLRLRLVGEFGDDYTERQLFDDLGDDDLRSRVDVVGLISGDAVFSEYGKGDLFVFSSLAYESFGMVMVEAMMSGLPVVAYDWRANAEVLTDRFGGVLASLDDEDPLSGLEDALRAALRKRSEWLAWGRSNRSVYLENYSMECLEQNWIGFVDSRATAGRPMDASEVKL